MEYSKGNAKSERLKDDKSNTKVKKENQRKTEQKPQTNPKQKQLIKKKTTTKLNTWQVM